MEKQNSDQEPKDCDSVFFEPWKAWWIEIDDFRQEHQWKQQEQRGRFRRRPPMRTPERDGNPNEEREDAE
jgi:hypothetical protein